MFRPKRPLTNFECALKERFRFGDVILGSVEAREIAESACDVWMIRPKLSLSDFQRALIKRFRLSVVTLGSVKVR